MKNKINLNESSDINEASKIVSAIIGATIGYLLGEETNTIIVGEKKLVEEYKKSLLNAKSKLSEENIEIMQKDRESIKTVKDLKEKTGIEIKLPCC